MSWDSQGMRLAVASGKGGTGKTTVAVNLAQTLSRRLRQVTYLDADVEAPNGHLFLRPEIASTVPVEMLVPQIDAEKCTGCGKCAEACEFGAIVMLGDEPTLFPELCHACGGCSLACPQDAIAEIPHRIGVVEEGMAGAVRFIQGRLDVGRPLSPPVIRAAKARIPAGGIAVVDCPPGTACAAVQAVSGSDLVLLVAEPTPFGLHDLDMAVMMLREVGPPYVVVANRSDQGIAKLREYCAANTIPILAEIPDDRQIAEICARGELIVDTLPGYEEMMLGLFEQVGSRAA